MQTPRTNFKGSEMDPVKTTGRESIEDFNFSYKFLNKLLE